MCAKSIRQTSKNSKSCPITSPACECGPSIRDPSADEADQRTFFATLAPRLSRAQVHIAQLVDEFVCCLDDRRCASLDHHTVHRTAQTCLARRTNTGSI